MDTQTFLQKVLPGEGTKYAIIFKKFKGSDGVEREGKLHKPFHTIAALADAIEQYEEDTSLPIYFACSSFKEDRIDGGVHPDGRTKWQYRVKANWSMAKAFWVDIDCGESYAAEGKGYATKKDAGAAIIKFCKDIGLVRPMIVDSGNGLHCYWPLTKPIDFKAWGIMAATLKSALTKYGVLADPTRTADFASILRPVGTTNRKRDPKKVKLIGDCELIKPSDMLHVLQSIRIKDELVVHEPRHTVVDNSEWLSQTPPPPMDAELLAEQCNQVRSLRDIKGYGTYDSWRLVIGLLKYCLNGEQYAADWSEDGSDWQTRYDTWSSPPPTCAAFKACNPEGCAGCRFDGKIHSPAKLGRKIIESEAVTVEAVVEDRPVQVEVPALPRGYRWDGKSLIRELPDKDGVVQYHNFSHTLFYPIYRLNTNGVFSLHFRAHLPDGRLREFSLDTGVVAAGGAALDKELGTRGEIAASNAKDSKVHMGAYLKDQLEQLKRTARERETYDAFGWHDENQSFVLGTTKIEANKEDTVVVLGGSAASYSGALDKRVGSAEGWSDAIHRLYGDPGNEPFQYNICAKLGSILGVFQAEEYKGIPTALTSSGSGLGKSSCGKVALYAFGDAEEMTINGNNGSTPMARTTLMSVFKNIPILVDEITNIKANEMSDFVYAASNGRDRVRLQSTGGEVKLRKSQSWNMVADINGNKNLGSLLSSLQANTEAEAVRFFEISLDQYQIPRISLDQFKLSLSEIRQNRGWAGYTFIKWVVNNRNKVFKMLADEAGLMPEISTTNSQYRFFRMQIECTMVAARIMGEIGLVQFDVDTLRVWAHKHMVTLCDSVASNNKVTSAEALDQMVNDLSGRIITTYEYRDGRDARGLEDPMNKPTGNMPAAGRYILGSKQCVDQAGKIYLTVKEARDWCLKQRLDLNTLLRDGEKRGVVIGRVERFNIGRGTSIPTANPPCIIIDMHKMNVNSVELPAPTLRIIPGAKLDALEKTA